VILVHSDDEKRLREIFTSVELYRRISCGRCMPYENGMDVWICRRPRVDLQTLWPKTKNFS
jgi:NADH:ubiquinone oxidoreductase subunit F (NADH-binding)